MPDDACCDRLISELSELIQIPSRSFPEGGEEGAVQALVAERMRSIGARVRTFEADDIPGARLHPLFCGPDRQYEGRPTVVGSIGPMHAPALLVMAHSDTVPIFEPDEWSCDPFSGEVRDGAIYGRGASDDKWGVACLLSLMRALMEREEPPPRQIHFASTIDEEHGVGNGLLLLKLADIQAEAALYLDGCEMSLCIGNCGGSNLNLRPREPIGQEEFQIHAAALQNLASEMSRERIPVFDRPFFRDNRQRELSVGVAARTDASGPYHLVSFYTLHGEDRRAFCADLERRVARALGKALSKYSCTYREPWFEPALSDPDAPFVRQMARAFRDVTQRDAHVTTVSKQDAFVFHNHTNTQTVSFGVSRAHGPGAVHRPDERVPLDTAWTGFSVALRGIETWLEEGV